MPEIVCKQRCLDRLGASRSGLKTGQSKLCNFEFGTSFGFQVYLRKPADILYFVGIFIDSLNSY